MTRDLFALLLRVQADYARCIDDDRLEGWPDYFDDPCTYKITTAANHRDGLPAGIVFADSRGMLIDRVSALREANIYERQTYRHILGVPSILSEDASGVRSETAFLVARIVLVGDVFVVEHYAAREPRDYAVRQITADVPPAAKTIDVLASTRFRAAPSPPVASRLQPAVQRSPLSRRRSPLFAPATQARSWLVRTIRPPRTPPESPSRVIRVNGERVLPGVGSDETVIFFNSATILAPHLMNTPGALLPMACLVELLSAPSRSSSHQQGGLEQTMLILNSETGRIIALGTHAPKPRLRLKCADAETTRRKESPPIVLIRPVVRLPISGGALNPSGKSANCWR